MAVGWEGLLKRQGQASVRRWLGGKDGRHVSWDAFRGACLGSGMKAGDCEPFLRALEQSGTVRYANGIVSTDTAAFFASVQKELAVAGTHRLDAKIEDLSTDLELLCRRKQAVDIAVREWRRRVWARTAAYCGGQMWLFARLTFGDFDWDTMEPITWFVMQGNAVAFFFFVWWYRREHTPEVWDDLVITNVAKDLYSQHNFDIERWASVKHDLAQLKAQRAATIAPL
ncbi:Calcium uniporter protein 5 [Diplonema papillatum]|nr:Calcium uniporter protein 5 [Diplonema papillatum]|eukprot:gene14794-22649_t